MRKLADIKGEEALDILADILEPATEIMTDQNVVNLARAGNKIKAVSAAIKNHKRAVIEILAILDGKNPETYKPPIVAIPVKLLEIFNDPDVVKVFTLQGQEIGEGSFGSAMATTAETETR